MELILLKSSACLLAFLIFYKVFLERTSQHQLKRFYLLAVVIISIAIPFITFIEYIEPQIILDSTNFNATPFTLEKIELEETTNYLQIILWNIYGLGVLLFASKFIYNLIQIFLKIKRNPKQKDSNFISVLLKDLVIPHTFFSYIFLNKTKFENKEIPQEVLIHEQTHARQKHSLDVLFIEFLQIIFWFNPLVFLLKKEVKLNHEFLADQAVINKGINPKAYQKLLLAYSSHATINPMAHAINYSLIKKRFTIMNTQTSKRVAWLRSLLFLPLLGILLFSFSTTKEVAPIVLDKEMKKSSDLLPTKLTARSIEIKVFNNGTYEIDGIKANKNTFVQVINQLHQDITPDVRNKILNIHVDSPKDISDKEVRFIYNSVLDYGFYRIVAYNQEVIRPKGNTPFALEKDTNNSKALVTQETLPMFGHSVFKGEPIFADKEFIKNAKVSTTTNDNVTGFKIKLITKPTLTIKGNKLNAKAIDYLSEARDGQIIQIFDIKIPSKQKLSPILISVVNKRVLGKYREVVEGEKSSLPPPPPPPAPKEKIVSNFPAFTSYIKQMEKDNNSIYFNNKKITAKDAIDTYKKYGKIDILTQRTGQGKYNVFLNKSKGLTGKMETQDLSLNPPPPPPPLSPNATPEQKKKYQEMLLKYKEVREKSMQVRKKAMNERLIKIDAQKANRLEKSKSKMTKREVALKEREATLKMKEATLKERESKMRKRPAGEETGYIEINGETHYYTKLRGKTTYYNRFGYRVDEKGNKLSKEQTEGDKVVKGQKITKIYKDDKVVSEFKKNWEDDGTNIPPPPPPMSTLDHVINMAKKGAKFYFNGDPVSSDKAIDILKKNPKTNISSQTNNGVSTVHLSTKPITIINGRVVKDKK